MLDAIDGASYPRERPIGCPLCGQEWPARCFTARFGMLTSVAECPNCRLAYQTPRPSEAASRAYMNWRWSSSGRYVTDSPGKRRSARRKLRYVQAVAPAVGSLLDFGAGSGTFVHACREAGVEAIGVEQSEAAAKRAEEFYGVSLEADLPDRYFDVITLWDVVEHLRDPVALLRKLRECLNPGGALLLSTGNYENWRRIADGDQWGLYLLDHHYYFTPTSIAAVLRDAGFSRCQILDVNHSRPPPGRTLKRPIWGLRAWSAYRRARRNWPKHGDINIMIAAAQPSDL